MSNIELQPEDLPDVAPQNHGRTRAAWVAMTGLVIGALLATFGMAIPVHALTWTGAAVAVLSLAAGAVLRALGHGQPVK